MNEREKTLALQKELLLARSSLYRAQLQVDALRLRSPAQWVRQGVTMVASFSAAREAVFGLLLKGAGQSRVRRLLGLAGGAVLLVKLGLQVATWWQKTRQPEPGEKD